MDKEKTYSEVYGNEKFFEVFADDNFYDSMVGRLVHSSPKTVVLEFKLVEELGGLQRVQFFKYQVAERTDL